MPSVSTHKWSSTLKQIGFDVFEDIDTRDELARRRRRSPLRHSGIVMMYFERPLQDRLQGLAEPSLAGAVVEKFGCVGAREYLRDIGRVAHRGDAEIGVFVHRLLHPTIFVGDNGGV